MKRLITYILVLIIPKHLIGLAKPNGNSIYIIRSRTPFIVMELTMNDNALLHLVKIWGNKEETTPIKFNRCIQHMLDFFTKYKKIPNLSNYADVTKSSRLPEWLKVFNTSSQWEGVLHTNEPVFFSKIEGNNILPTDFNILKNLKPDEIARYICEMDFFVEKFKCQSSKGIPRPKR